MGLLQEAGHLAKPSQVSTRAHGRDLFICPAAVPRLSRGCPAFRGIKFRMSRAPVPRLSRVPRVCPASRQIGLSRDPRDIQMVIQAGLGVKIGVNNRR